MNRRNSISQEHNFKKRSSSRMCDPNLIQTIVAASSDCTFHSQMFSNDQLVFVFFLRECQRNVLCTEPSLINGQLYVRDFIKFGLPVKICYMFV